VLHPHRAVVLCKPYYALISKNNWEENIMEIPEYITIDEVKRVCKKLNLRDWTALTKPKIAPEEAKKRSTSKE